MTGERLRYLAYQAAARKLATSSLLISERPVVQMTEDGAFVEASIWIPATAITVPNGVDDGG